MACICIQTLYLSAWKGTKMQIHCNMFIPPKKPLPTTGRAGQSNTLLQWERATSTQQGPPKPELKPTTFWLRGHSAEHGATVLPSCFFIWTHYVMWLLFVPKQYVDIKTEQKVFHDLADNGSAALVSMTSSRSRCLQHWCV